MYYCFSFFPQFNPELTKAINAIRNVHDPTAPYYPPHITLIFPTHHSVGEQPLIDHIEKVLAHWSPFDIRLGGFRLKRDYWLFLLVAEGEDHLKKLYRDLHTGFLDDGRDVNWFLPHVGLGLFVKEGRRHDWRNPLEADFDRERYEEAIHLVEALPLAEPILVDKLVLGTISDAVIDWTRGRCADLPDDANETTVREFLLDQPGK